MVQVQQQANRIIRKKIQEWVWNNKPQARFFFVLSPHTLYELLFSMFLSNTNSSNMPYNIRAT